MKDQEIKAFKGTPGPWKPFYTSIMGDVTGKVQGITVMPDRRQSSQHVAVSWDASQIGRNGCLKFEEAEANAKLIASAPELLEALQKVYRIAKQIGLAEDLDFEEYDYIGEAINKALGTI